MGYRLRRDQPAEQAVRAVARDQIERGLGELADEEVGRHEAVHQVRKRFKKIRALLRLVRPALGHTYGQENRRYRDLGRSLSPVRDAEAALESLDALLEHFGHAIDGAPFAGLREGLVARRRAVADQEQDLDGRLDRLDAELRQAWQRVAGWRVDEEGWDALGPGLAKTYRRGRKAMAEARKRPTAAVLHEWRKRAKYHWYHLRLLHDAWPGVMEGWADEVGQLTTLLGDDHDLVLLADLLEDRGAELADDGRTVDALLGLVARRRAALQEEAFALGERAFGAEKTKRLAARLGAWWQAP